MERHLSKCTDARRIRDWKSALRETDAAIAAGADFSPQVKKLVQNFLSLNYEEVVQLTDIENG